MIYTDCPNCAGSGVSFGKRCACPVTTEVNMIFVSGDIKAVKATGDRRFWPIPLSLDELDQDLVAVAAFALQQAGTKEVGPGWKVAPVEPTEEMLSAGCQSSVDKPWSYANCYQNMIAAAPQPPASTVQSNSFRDHLQKCSDTVATWPSWKRRASDKASTPSTGSIEETERELFEAEYGPRDSFAWRTEEGKYKSTPIQMAWEVWQKRAALDARQPVAASAKDAERLEWLIQWAIEGRPRAELHEHGHIVLTTRTIVLDSIDAAIATTKDVQ